VGVKGGIAGAAGAVPEGSGHEAVCSLDGYAAVSSTDVTGVAFQVGDGGVNASFVAVDHGLSGVPVTQSPYQGHRLGCRQREVEPGQACRRRAERFVASRALAGQHGSEVLGHDPSLETELCRPAPEPPAGCLADVDVVVLGAVQDLFEVVGLLAEAQLPDAQHGSLPAGRELGRTLVQVCGYVRMVQADGADLWFT
jgi:hypothetical protein